VGVVVVVVVVVVGGGGGGGAGVVVAREVVLVVAAVWQFERSGLRDFLGRVITSDRFWGLISSVNYKYNQK
jgi:hypothetical protein